MRGIVQAEATQRRVKEYQNKAAVRGKKRTKSSPEEGQRCTNNQQPTITAATTSSSSSSSSSRARQREQAALEKAMDPAGWTTRGRQNGEHPENPEREDGKCTRTEGNKRKTIEAERACCGKL